MLAIAQPSQLQESVFVVHANKPQFCWVTVRCDAESEIPEVRRAISGFQRLKMVDRTEEKRVGGRLYINVEMAGEDEITASKKLQSLLLGQKFAISDFHAPHTESVLGIPGRLIERYNSQVIKKGILRGLYWESRGGYLWQVYIPVKTEGYPNGKIVAGGTFGKFAHDQESAVAAIESAMQAFRKENHIHENTFSRMVEQLL